MSKCFALLLLAGLSHRVTADLADINTWSTSISDAADTIVGQTMQVAKLQEIINQQPYTNTHIDGTVSAAVGAARVARILTEKKLHLQTMAAKVREVYKNKQSAEHGIDSAASLPSTAIDASSCTKIGWQKFGTQILDTQSTYRKPFVENAEVDNDLGASAMLDSTFEANSDADHNLALQYFGSRNGLLRSYPGIEWGKSGSEYDDHDARLTPWYASAVSDSKNVLLVVDLSSASAHAASISAIESVLKTLSLNDYIGIITFSSSKSPTLMSSADCFTAPVLIRATPYNLEKLRTDITDLAAPAVSASEVDVASAFTFAFKILAETKTLGLGAACSTTILFLSGTPSITVDHNVLVEQNTAIEARIFTYATDAGSDAETLKQIACKHTGAYFRVDQGEDAKLVGLYYQYIGGTPTEDDSQTPFVHLTYGRGMRPGLFEDSNEFYNPLFTMSTAVYTDAVIASTDDTSIEGTLTTATATSKKLLGVVALDFNMYELKDVMESMHFQDSFSFLVNFEGDTLYHPLQTKYKSLDIFDAGRDIGKYEYFAGWRENVRPGLISGEQGEAALQVPRAIAKGDAKSEGLDTRDIDTRYFWQPVGDWPLVLAYAYSERDLTQRMMTPSLYPESTEYMYKTIDRYRGCAAGVDDCDDSMIALQPAAATATLRDGSLMTAGTQMAQIVPAADGSASAVYNINNCAVSGVNYMTFKNKVLNGKSESELPAWAGTSAAAGFIRNCDGTLDSSSTTCTVLFHNCITDGWCSAQTSNGYDVSDMCNPTSTLNSATACTCEPNRWPVSTIARWPSTMFAPMCFEDQVEAFSKGQDVGYAKAMHLFMNSHPGAVNPAPVLREKCSTAVKIISKWTPTVKQASVDGYHDLTVWSYFGSSSGFYHMFPGTQYGNTYDPTRRPWYARAMTFNRQYQHVVSTPYMDFGGAGLMNTFSETAWEEADLSTSPPTVVSDKVFGVHGWDMLYSTMNNFLAEKTVVDGMPGCAILNLTHNVHNYKAHRDEAVCFLMDPSGLLITHPDFLIPSEDAALAGYDRNGVDANGEWPIENVFIGKKEPAIAKALISTGVLTPQSQASDDSSLQLNWFEVDDSKFVHPTTGAPTHVGGSLNDPNCIKSGATWRAMHIAKTNMFLVAIEDYERPTAFATSCAEVTALPTTPITFDKCTHASTTMAAKGFRRAPQCPVRISDKIFTTLEMEAVRPDTGSSAGNGTCTYEAFIAADSSEGTIVTAVSTLMTLFAVLLAVALWVFRKKYIIMASSPYFCMLMCLGAVIGYSFMFTMIGRPSEPICTARNWLGGIAFALLFGPLFGKTYRIHKIFNNKKLKKVRISNMDVLQGVVAVLGAQVLLLIVWTGVEVPEIIYVADPVDPFKQYVQCSSENMMTWLAVNYIFTFSFVCYGVFLCYMTRNAISEFNESGQIGSAIYNMAFMGLIIIPLVYGLDISMEAEFALVTLGIIGVVTTTLLVLFVPKFMNLNKSKEDFKTGYTTSATSDNTPGPAKVHVESN
jgi:gamma-aminobutyric acid type B receptor